MEPMDEIPLLPYYNLYIQNKRELRTMKMIKQQLQSKGKHRQIFCGMMIFRELG
jgi:hypothetical protein